MGSAYGFDNSRYFSSSQVVLPDGRIVEKVVINGPPKPVPGFEHERQPADLYKAYQAAGAMKILDDVPKYQWVFGCSAVSAAMIAAYYDGNGYPGIYTGPTNGGIMPESEDAAWGTWIDACGERYPRNPLIASHNGLDGRRSEGSIDNYWDCYGRMLDPFLIEGRTEHAWGDAIGDYMKTSQFMYDNTDGSTTFYYFWDGERLYCDDMVREGIDNDGLCGLRDFYAARGYIVIECYSQYTNNVSGRGFSYEDFKAEIDAGRPVMVHLKGHTVVGVGYQDPNTIYIHDTWDHSIHSLRWGTSYAGMSLLGVSILHLAQAPTDIHTLSVVKTGTGSGAVTSQDGGISCGRDCEEIYPRDTVVTLWARADAGSTWGGWSGDCAPCGFSISCYVPMWRDWTCRARFDSGDLDVYWEDVQEVYVAYYGRPADPEGQDYWAGRLMDVGGDLDEIIDAFGTSTEFDENYGHLSHSALIDKLYLQMFNRLPDRAGKAFYLEQLTTGARTLQSICLDILYGAVGTDATTVANKVKAAEYFTDLLRLDPDCPYTSENIPALKAILQQVDETAASVAAAEALMDDYCSPQRLSENVRSVGVTQAR